MPDEQGTPNEETEAEKETPENPGETTDKKETGPSPTEKAPTPGPKEQGPEAYDLKRDDKSLISAEKFEDIAKYAKDNGLTKKQAESLLDLQEDAIGDRIEKFQTEHKEKVKTWQNDLSSRKEYAEEKQHVDRAMQKFGTEQLSKELNSTGYTHYEPMWQFLKEIGKALSDDKFVSGLPKGNTKDRANMSLGERMYGAIK